MRTIDVPEAAESALLVALNDRLIRVNELLGAENRLGDKRTKATQEVIANLDAQRRGLEDMIEQLLKPVDRELERYFEERRAEEECDRETVVCLADPEYQDEARIDARERAADINAVLKPTEIA